MNLGHSERAAERSEEALAILETLGDGSGIARILDGRAMATFLEGDIRVAADSFDRVAKLFVDSGELLRAITPRSTRGHALIFLVQPQDAIADIEQALDLARTLGHPEGEAYAQWHLAEALVALGREDEAVAAAKQALSIAEVGSRRAGSSARGTGRRRRCGLGDTSNVDRLRRIRPLQVVDAERKGSLQRKFLHQVDEPVEHLELQTWIAGHG